MSASSLKILIVEDDLSFALELGILVEKIGYQVVATVDNSAEALELIFSENPDLILMDIDIKGKLTGIQIGQKIKHLDIPILYLTSFGSDEYYQEAKRSNMIGYLVKPLDKYSLRSSIELAIKNTYLENTDNQTIIDDFVIKNSFFFKKKNQYFKVGIDEITYIESDDKYCLTYTKNSEKFVSRIPISQLEKTLPAEKFLRIHRGYIIALDKISTINFFEGTLSIEGKELPISRANRKVLQERMNRFE